MAEKIIEPGIYLDMPTADYFADPAPMPSLTQSIAKILLERSPLHAWHAHPRLNPDYRHDDDTKFDVGNVAHKLMLGRGKEVVRLEFDDWRTKAAKEARDVAASAGKLAVLGHQYARAERMVAAAREQLTLRDLDDLFRDGDSEVIAAWREDEARGPTWFRQMIDWLSPDRMTFADYKTTDYSVAPHNLGRMMVAAGWDIQGAMGARALTALLGPARRRFLFVAQETESPYCLSVVELSQDALTMGGKKLDAAVKLWAACQASDCWPGYPLEVVIPEYPGWAESAWLQREIDDAARERWASDELSRRKDEGEPLSGHGRAVHNILQAG